MYVATIGGFDGVHCGHQFVLQKMIEIAVDNQLSTLVFGFSSKSFWAERQQELLTTNSQRKSRILAMGIDRFEWLDFDKVRTLEAKSFLAQMQAQYEVKIWVYTQKLYIGKDRKSFLGLREEIEGVKFVEIPLQVDERGTVLSSTEIRKFLQEGRVAAAMNCLGQPYRIEGEVESGVGQGKTIGFPTLNLAKIPTLLPADGVYATICNLQEEKSHSWKRYNSMTFVGNTLTKTAGAGRMVESHLLNFLSSGYNGVAYLEFLDFLRPVCMIRDLEDLQRLLVEDRRRVFRFFMDRLDRLGEGSFFGK